MFKLALGFFTLLLTSTVFISGSQAQPPAQAGEKIRVWIQYAPSHGNDIAQELKAINAKVHYHFDDLNAFAATIPTQARQGLMNNPHVVLVEEDPKRKPLSQATPWGITDVQAPLVWPSEATGDGVLVCVIDSGLYAQHEDHNTTNFRSITGHSKFSTEDWNVDGCGHGTHVAGTIAALNNTTGVVGVAPTDPSQGIAGVSLHIEKVFDSACGNAYSSDIVNAAKLCQQKGAKVISMSLGSDRKSRSEQKAFDNLYKQGVLSVAAAGNDGNGTSSYPASYDSVVSVAAVDNTNTVASFSNQNSQVELAAPGVDVKSTVPFLNTLTANGTTYNGGHIENSAWDSVSGEMVDGGLCDTTDSRGGKIVLCERGNITFYEKVMNVQSSGGIAAAIYNNEQGGFAGTLGTGNSSNIPAISLSQEDGQALLAAGPPASGSLVSSKEASGYEAWAGTSMATPHVAGVAALIWSANTSWSNVDVRTALQNSAFDLGASGRDNAYGYGLVQAQTALAALGGSPSGKPTADFSVISCDDNLSCSFTNLSSAGAYNWDFGDGSSGTQASHTYAAAGSYPVTLTVTANGVSASTIHQVDVAGSTSGSPSGTDNTPPIISDVAASAGKGPTFKIMWTTDEPATSVVTFTNLQNATYTNDTLVTAHSMSFRGTKGFTYEFTVSSTDASGNTATDPTTPPYYSYTP